MTLLEAAVATALVATVAGATLAAAISGAHAAGGDPIRDALAARARGELALALDVLKYQGTTLDPKTVATTVALPTGSPLPVQMSISTSAALGGATTVTVTVKDLSDTGEMQSESGTLDSRAPLPGSQSHAPGLVAAPTGAP